ncbi:MAG: DUF362 domain-containing protein [Pseudobutyrivibrio sp.]|nr:DUF362 domain-containing protein [Pseudobutyrivibrio sp.]
MNSRITLVQIDKAQYPNKTDCFRPDEDYPEYIFAGCISKEKNYVYRGVREAFHLNGMDNENYGSDKWNPLKDTVKPGDNVLIKPNLVLDKNDIGGTDCLYTQAAVVAPVVDYVIKALEGTGKIVIGDAPLQECDFDTLISNSGYKELVNFYKEQGINIELVDFRNVKTIAKDNIRTLREAEGHEGRIIKLDDKSMFNSLDQDRISRLRITNYDPRILQSHHDVNHHEYNVANYILDADVVINMPKPKTHRKAGVTSALKNMVGINANKEFLPHHTVGSQEEGGDAYPNKDDYYLYANQVLDIKNVLTHDGKFEQAKLAADLYSALNKLGKRNDSLGYWEGSWYGNDTIWRTIVDLNRILFFANKKGEICDSIQRKYLIVADMIVSGEKEGPLIPSPIYPGVIAVGDNPVLFDKVICQLMGFDYKKIPSVSNAKILFPDDREDIQVRSNNKAWDNASLDGLLNNSLQYQPTSGWEECLGNKYKDVLVTSLQESSQEIYVWGAGPIGRKTIKLLLEKNIKVLGIFDNDQGKNGKEILCGIKCLLPEDDLSGKKILISTKIEYVKDISRQISESGGEIIGVWN